MDRAGKLYTQLSIFLSPDKDTAAALSVVCGKLAEEVAPPSGYTTFQAHMGHYLRRLCAETSWRDSATLRCHYLPGTQGALLPIYTRGIVLTVLLESVLILHFSTRLNSNAKMPISMDKNRTSLELKKGQPVNH